MKSPKVLKAVVKEGSKHPDILLLRDYNKYVGLVVLSQLLTVMSWIFTVVMLSLDWVSGRGLFHVIKSVQNLN